MAIAATIRSLAARKVDSTEIARVARREQLRLERAASSENNGAARSFLQDLAKQMGERHLEYAQDALEADRQMEQLEDQCE